MPKFEMPGLNPVSPENKEELDRNVTGEHLDEEEREELELAELQRQQKRQEILDSSSSNVVSSENIVAEMERKKKEKKRKKLFGRKGGGKGSFRRFLKDKK